MRNIGYKSAFGKYRRFKILFVFISIFTIPNFLISNSYADDATNWFNKGSKAYCKGNYDEAIKDCTKAIELNPKYAKAYYFRGRAYYDKGLYDEAIEDYNKTIKLNPKHADAYWCRGLAYDKKGLHNEAIKDYTKANNIYKNYKAESLLTGEGLFNKGLSYYKEGDYYKAKITFVEFINKYPNSRLIPKVRYYLGRTNMGLGDYINAVNNFLIALKLEPKNKEAQKYIAKSYNELGHEALSNSSYKKAAQYFEIALQYNSKEEYLKNLKEAKRKKKEKERQANLAPLLVELRKLGNKIRPMQYIIRQKIYKIKYNTPPSKMNDGWTKLDTFLRNSYAPMLTKFLKYYCHAIIAQAEKVEKDLDSGKGSYPPDMPLFSIIRKEVLFGAKIQDLRYIYTCKVTAKYSTFRGITEVDVNIIDLIDSAGIDTILVDNCEKIEESLGCCNY